jgi:hypothetical protein
MLDPNPNPDPDPYPGSMNPDLQLCQDVLDSWIFEVKETGQVTERGEGVSLPCQFIYRTLMSFKGTMPRDFRPQVFFINQFHASENFHVIS